MLDDPVGSAAEASAVDTAKPREMVDRETAEIFRINGFIIKTLFLK